MHDTSHDGGLAIATHMQCTASRGKAGRCRNDATKEYEESRAVPGRAPYWLARCDDHPMRYATGIRDVSRCG